MSTYGPCSIAMGQYYRANIKVETHMTESEYIRQTTFERQRWGWSDFAAGEEEDGGSAPVLLLKGPHTVSDIHDYLISELTTSTRDERTDIHTYLRQRGPNTASEHTPTRRRLEVRWED